MPAAKLLSSGTLNAMKSEEGNDSIDTLIRQAIGKEPLLPFPRTVDNPVQWIQFLHALDQPDLPGWPLLTPVKVQMQKCEKCSREFCSPINYRRHIRVHRRTLNINKEWHKNRDLLSAFWDKLSLHQAVEVVSFNDISIKDKTGPSVVKALAASLRKPGVWTLPQPYVKAGASLLEILQAKPGRLPISSSELFSILDDASESTFLCAGTAESVQKYVFDGETARASLELKNLVAVNSFLFEKLLVKAWVAAKDAEALRCQKLLVEEEEAAQKRQAVILERKKQKKLRKEQKVKEKYFECSRDLNVCVDAVDRPTSAEASDLSSPSDSNSQDVPTNFDSDQPQQKESDEDIEGQFDLSSEHKRQGDSPAVELQVVTANGHRNIATNRLHAPKSQRGSRYGLHANSNHQTLKPELIHKHGPSKDRSLQNGSKVWTKKLKSNNDGDNPRPCSFQEVSSHPIEQNNREVIIGSIPVRLKSYVDQVSPLNETQDTCSTEHVPPKKKNASEKLAKSNTVQTNRVASRLWRPVSRGETKNVTPVSRSVEGPEDGAVLSKVNDSDGCHNEKQLLVLSDENAQRGSVPFDSEAVRDFLARRWKEAIAGDHTTLRLSSDPCRIDAPYHAENRLGRTNHVHVARKAEKSVKFKYIPKQKAAA